MKLISSSISPSTMSSLFHSLPNSTHLISVFACRYILKILYKSISHNRVWGREEAPGLLGSGSLLGAFSLIHLSSSEGRDAHPSTPQTQGGSAPPSPSPGPRAGTSCTAGKQGQASLENKWPETQSLCGQGQNPPSLHQGGSTSAGMCEQRVEGALKLILARWGKSG